MPFAQVFILFFSYDKGPVTHREEFYQMRTKKLFQATHGHTSERNFASALSFVIPFAGCIGKGNRLDFGV